MNFESLYNPVYGKIEDAPEDFENLPDASQGEMALPKSDPGFFDGMTDTWKAPLSAGLKSLAGFETSIAETNVVGSALQMYETETGEAIENPEEREKQITARIEEEAREHRELAQREYSLDPETSGFAAQMMFGLAETLPKAVGYSILGGPVGGAVGFGVDVGANTYGELRDKGVDKGTAAVAGLTSGALNAIGVWIPATFGKSRAQSATIGALANFGLTGAELAGVGFALASQDYDDLADQYGLNWTSLATSAVFGGVFGGAMYRAPRAYKPFDEVQRKSVYDSMYEQLKAVGGKYANDEVASVQARLHASGVEIMAKRASLSYEQTMEIAPSIVRDDGSLDVSAFNEVTFGYEWVYGDKAAREGDKALTVVKTSHSDKKFVERNRLSDSLKTFLNRYVTKVDGNGEASPQVPLRNAETGWTFTISSRDRDEIVSKIINKHKDSSDLKEVAIIAVENLPAVVSRAYLAESYRDLKFEYGLKGNDPDLIGIHRFYTPVSVDGELYAVKLTVKDKSKIDRKIKNIGDKPRVEFYSLESLEVYKIKQGQTSVNQSERSMANKHLPLNVVESAEQGALNSVDSNTAAIEDVILPLPSPDMISVESFLRGVNRDGDATFENGEKIISSRFFEDEPMSGARGYRNDENDPQWQKLQRGEKLNAEEAFKQQNIDGSFTPDSDLIARAKENFGVTNDPKEAFYVLPDGSMLDGSGRHWGGSEVDVRGQRQVDHGDVGEVMDSSGAQAMYDFMSQTGAMRFDANAGIASIARTPTPEQLAVLSRTSQGKYLALSRNTPEGRIVDDVEFERASASDIRKFFDKAEELYREGVQGALAQRSEGGTLGSYSPATREIKLTPNANLSTFSHEMGHWYLDTMFKLSGRGSADLDGDVATLLREFGIKSVDDWNKLGVEGQRKYQEQFASWLEVYLSKGEAPKPTLERLFERVKEWILDVYESLGGTQKAVEGRFESEFGEKLPEMSEEVKGVMDRLFAERKAKQKATRATSDQVAAARVVLNDYVRDERLKRIIDKASKGKKVSKEDAMYWAACTRAMQIAEQQLVEGRPVDVSTEMRDVPIDEGVINDARGQFMREHYMGGDDSRAVILQNRDRDTVASVGQMNRIAAKPDYYLASFSRTLQDGAPIVSFGEMPDKVQMGREDIVTTSDGNILIQYGVVEADDILTSNDYLGNANPEYGDPTKINAVAGNGRVTGIREGYNRGTADKYREDMMADQLHGVDPEVIKGMKKPILVRFMSKDFVTSKLIDESNKQTTLARSPVEQAFDDARHIARNVETYQFDADGLPTEDTVRQFVNDIGEPNALGRLLTPNGSITPEAVTRVQNAVVQAAYGDMVFTQLVAMETKPGAKRLMNALVAIAPKFVQIRNALGPAYDFSRQLLEGFKQVRESILAGQDSVIQSGSIFGDDSASFFVDMLDRNRNSMAGLLRELNPIFEAIEQVKSQQGGMFGDAPMDFPEIIARVRQAENEDRLAEGKPLLMDVNPDEIRQSMVNAQETIDAANELQARIDEARALEAEPTVQTETIEAKREASRALLGDDGQQVMLHNIGQEMPDMVYEVEDVNGNVVKMTVEEVEAAQNSILEQAEIDEAAMGKAVECVLNNQGI